MILKTFFNRKTFLFLCIAILMTSLLGYSVQAQPLPSPLAVDATAPEAPEAVLTHATVADFDQACAARTNTHVSENLSGSVELAGVFNDNFDGTALDSGRWVSGSWIGGSYTPLVSGGKVVLPPGGYVRSNTATFTRGVMEGKIEFTQGAWQNVGFAPLGFNSRYLLFSTLNTSGITTTLYARIGLITLFHDQPMGLLPTGSQRYKIDWQAADATYDRAIYTPPAGGTIFSTGTFSNTILSNLNLWISNNGTTDLSVDEIQVAPPYAASGSYISCPLDAAAGMIWQTASWISSLPANTTLTVQTRTSPDGSTNWTGWSALTSGANIASPNRFVQYQLSLGTTNATTTPALDSISFTSVGFSSDLNLTKTISATNPDVGQTVNFTVTVNNSGPNNATGVEVRDLLQSGYTYSSFSATQGTYNNSTGIWTVGTVPAAGNAVLTIVATVNTTGVYSNAAEVWKNDLPDPDSTPGNSVTTEDDYATLTVVPVPIANLGVTKTDAPDPAVAGMDVTYVVTVQNLGPSTATSVVLTDTLPTGVTYKSVTPGSWTCTTPTPGKVRCTLASLGVTNSNVSIVATVKPETRVSVTNQVDVKSATVDRAAGNNTFQAATAITSLADLELSKVARSATPIMGSTQVFTVTVTNKGPSQATGVKVKDLLETGYQFTGAIASPGSYVAGTGEWTVGTLAVNQSATLRLTSTVKTTGTYNNYAQVTASNEPDPDSTPNDGSTTQDDDDSLTVTAVPGADLSLVKLVSKTTPYVGESVVFTVTVTNAGPSPATGVTVKDLLNSGYTFVGSSQPGSYDAQTGMWNVGTLTASESRWLTITAQVKPSGNYQNIAEVWQSQVSDLDSIPGNGATAEDDYGTLTLNPVPAADLSIVKTLVTAHPEIGKEVVFQIRVTNSGPNSAGGVTIRDVMPANHVFVSADQTPVINGNELTWNLGTLTASQEVTIQLTLRANVTGSYSNQVQVMTSSVHDPDSQPGNSAPGEDDLSSVQYGVNYHIYVPIILKNP